MPIFTSSDTASSSSWSSITNSDEEDGMLSIEKFPNKVSVSVPYIPPGLSQPLYTYTDPRTYPKPPKEFCDDEEDSSHPKPGRSNGDENANVKRYSSHGFMLSVAEDLYVHGPENNGNVVITAYPYAHKLKKQTPNAPPSAAINMPSNVKKGPRRVQVAPPEEKRGRGKKPGEVKSEGSGIDRRQTGYNSEERLPTEAAGDEMDEFAVPSEDEKIESEPEIKNVENPAEESEDSKKSTGGNKPKKGAGGNKAKKVEGKGSEPKKRGKTAGESKKADNFQDMPSESIEDAQTETEGGNGPFGKASEKKRKPKKVDQAGKPAGGENTRKSTDLEDDEPRKSAGGGNARKSTYDEPQKSEGGDKSRKSAYDEPRKSEGSDKSKKSTYEEPRKSEGGGNARKSAYKEPRKSAGGDNARKSTKGDKTRKSTDPRKSKKSTYNKNSTDDDKSGADEPRASKAPAKSRTFPKSEEADSKSKLERTPPTNSMKDVTEEGGEQKPRFEIKCSCGESCNCPNKTARLVEAQFLRCYPMPQGCYDQRVSQTRRRHCCPTGPSFNTCRCQRCKVRHYCCNLRSRHQLPATDMYTGIVQFEEAERGQKAHWICNLQSLPNSPDTVGFMDTDIPRRWESEYMAQFRDFSGRIPPFCRCGCQDANNMKNKQGAESVEKGATGNNNPNSNEDGEINEEGVLSGEGGFNGEGKFSKDGEINDYGAEGSGSNSKRSSKRTSSDKGNQTKEKQERDASTGGKSDGSSGNDSGNENGSHRRGASNAYYKNGRGTTNSGASGKFSLNYKDQSEGRNSTRYGHVSRNNNQGSSGADSSDDGKKKSGVGERGFTDVNFMQKADRVNVGGGGGGGGGVGMGNSPQVHLNQCSLDKLYEPCDEQIIDYGFDMGHQCSCTQTDVYFMETL